MFRASPCWTHPQAGPGNSRRWDWLNPYEQLVVLNGFQRRAEAALVNLVQQGLVTGVRAWSLMMDAGSKCRFLSRQMRTLLTSTAPSTTTRAGGSARPCTAWNGCSSPQLAPGHDPLSADASCPGLSPASSSPDKPWDLSGN